MKKVDLSTRAAAELHDLAQANKVLRLYRDHVGRDATSVDELTAWAVEHRDLISGQKPNREDYDRADRARPDLVALAADPEALDKAVRQVRSALRG